MRALSNGAPQLAESIWAKIEEDLRRQMNAPIMNERSVTSMSSRILIHDPNDDAPIWGRKAVYFSPRYSVVTAELPGPEWPSKRAARAGTLVPNIQRFPG